MSSLLATLPTPAAGQQPPLAVINSNMDLIDRWLFDKSSNSQRAYRRDVEYFLAYVENRSLAAVSLNDVQGYAAALVTQGYAAATVARRVNAIKSLLRFGHSIGALRSNVGAPAKPPVKIKNTLAERILTESQALTMIAMEPSDRNKVLLRFLYATGARVSEVSALRWRDLQPAADCTGQATLFGKGGKTRAVMFSAETWDLVQRLKTSDNVDAPVFASRNGNALHSSQIAKIVRAAGDRIGIKGVSPHWFRHSHASHALDRGVGIHLVQQTLGHSSVAVTGMYLHARPQDSSGLHLAV